MVSRSLPRTVNGDGERSLSECLASGGGAQQAFPEVRLDSLDHSQAPLYFCITTHFRRSCQLPAAVRLSLLDEARQSKEKYELLNLPFVLLWRERVACKVALSSVRVTKTQIQPFRVDALPDSAVRSIVRLPFQSTFGAQNTDYALFVSGWLLKDTVGLDSLPVLTYLLVGCLAGWLAGW